MTRYPRCVISRTDDQGGWPVFLYILSAIALKVQSKDNSSAIAEAVFKLGQTCHQSLTEEVCEGSDKETS